MQPLTMILLDSEEHARSVASFPVKIPSVLPRGFKLARFSQWWPPWMTEDQMSAKVHADFVQSIYRDESDGHLVVTQGFISMYIAFVQQGTLLLTAVVQSRSMGGMPSG